MRLLDILRGSYTVREQDAAQYIDNLEKALIQIKKALIEGDLFITPQDVVSLIEGTLSNGEE